MSSASDETSAAQALLEFESLGGTPDDIPVRQAAAIIGCAGRGPLSSMYADKARAVLCSQLNRSHKQQQLDIFVGVAASFMKIHGNLADLVQLMDVVQSDDACTMTVPFMRQFCVSLAYHSLPQAFELCRRAVLSEEVSRVFAHAEPRQSEKLLADWDSYSGPTKAAVIVSSIIISQCADRASESQLKSDSQASPTNDHHHHSFVTLVKILDFVKSSSIPMTEETCGRAILGFAAPLNSSYFASHSSSMDADAAFRAVHDLVGHVVIKTQDGGAWIGNALIRLCGQLDTSLDRAWRVLTCMHKFGFLLPAAAQVGGSLTGRATTSRALKITARLISQRRWPIQGDKIYFQHIANAISTQLDGDQKCVDHNKFSTPMTVSKFIILVHSIHAPFGTPLNWS